MRIVHPGSHRPAGAYRTRPNALTPAAAGAILGSHSGHREATSGPFLAASGQTVSAWNSLTRIERCTRKNDRFLRRGLCWRPSSAGRSL